MSDQGPNLIDITIKEGGLRVNHCLLLDQVKMIAQELESAGMAYAEICHGRGIGGKEIGYPGLHTDKEILEGLKGQVNSLKLCVYIAPYDYSFSQIDSLAPFFDIGRVAVNVHEPKEGQKSIKKLKELKKQVFAQILRVHARSPKECAKTAQQLADYGAEVIYLSDSYGSMDPDDVKKYLEAVAKKITVPLGFQGKNSTGKAMVNTLAAWQAGAQWLDGAILGMGPGAGVAVLEELVANLQKEGLCNNIKLEELATAGKFFVRPALRTLPFIQYLDLLMAKHQLDFYPQELLEAFAGILDMELDQLIIDIKETRPDLVQLREADLKNYLKTHRLDYDVVLKFIKTGQIPDQANLG